MHQFTSITLLLYGTGLLFERLVADIKDLLVYAKNKIETAPVKGEAKEKEATIMKGPIESKQGYIRLTELLSASTQGRSIPDICDMCDMPVSFVYSLVDSMAAYGLVERTGGWVALTEDGRESVAGMLRNYTAVRDHLKNTVGLDEATAGAVACALEGVLDYGKLFDKLALPESPVTAQA